MFAFARKPSSEADSATSAAPQRGKRQPARINHTWLRLATSVGSHASDASERGAPQSGAPIHRKCSACGGEKAAPGVSSPADPSEREADRAADEVMRMAEPGPLGTSTGIQRMAEPAPLSASPTRIHRMCTECEDEQKQVQTKRDASAGGGARCADTGGGGKGMDAGAAVRVAARGGAPLAPEVRSYFEPRFGHDFSAVRVHADGAAAEGAQAVRARAYTTGRDIVFGAGQYSPDTHDGRRLLAHELAHVVQQGGHADDTIQRCADAATDTTYDTKATAVKAHAEYGKLADKTKADDIITVGKTKDNCLYYIDKLKVLFDTPVNPPSTTGSSMRAGTSSAVTDEATRLGTEKGKGLKNLEEEASAKAVFTKEPGKFGGKYEIDKRDLRNVVIRANVALTAKGGGKATDVADLKTLQDAIEKHASTKGYIVDLEWVAPGTADAFEVGVDTDKWEYSDNWAGGGPKGYAHELHHLLAFPLDRYDYIESHAANKDMDLDNRLHWFREEMNKPPGYNTSTSIMNDAEHPSNNDVCEVAGATGAAVATCVATRDKVDKMFKDIKAKYATYDERILNVISKNLKADKDTTIACTRELFRELRGSKKDRENILKRAKDAGDPFSTVFGTLPSAEQTEFLAIITVPP